MLTYGFYNSLNGDRKYDSAQISSIFDGIIEDGVYSNIGEQFITVPGSGMQVIVKTGRAWFKHTWTLNDSWMVLDIDPSDRLRSRIDSVVLEVNSNIAVRENSIKIVKGALASSPEPPIMIHADGVDQYRLANITVNPDVSTLTEYDISNKVGTEETPFVVAPIKTVDVSYLYSEWEGQFEDWFSNIKAQLEGSVATNLQKQIDERVKIADKATKTDITNGTPGKWVDAQSIKEVVSGLNVGDIVFSMRDLEVESNGMMLACDQREIEVDEYPELCNIGTMQYRYDRFTKSDASIYDRDTYYYADEYKFLNGPIYKGYLYHAITNANTLTIERMLLEPGSKTFADVVSISLPTLSNSTIQASYCFVFKESLMYILTTAGSLIYIVDLNSLTYSATQIDNIPDSYPGPTSNYMKTFYIMQDDPTDNIRLCILISSSNYTNWMRWVTYSTDLTSRTSYSGNVTISRNVTYAFLRHTYNIYTGNTYDYYGGEHVIAGWPNSSATTSYLHLFYKNVSVQNTTYTETNVSSYLKTAPSTSDRVYDTYSIVNKSYVYLFVKRNHGIDVLILNRSDKSFVKCIEFTNGAFTPYMQLLYVSDDHSYIRYQDVGQNGDLKYKGVVTVNLDGDFIPINSTEYDRNRLNSTGNGSYSYTTTVNNLGSNPYPVPYTNIDFVKNNGMLLYTTDGGTGDMYDFESGAVVRSSTNSGQLGSAVCWLIKYDSPFMVFIRVFASYSSKGYMACVNIDNRFIVILCMQNNFFTGGDDVCIFRPFVISISERILPYARYGYIKAKPSLPE